MRLTSSTHTTREPFHSMVFTESIARQTCLRRFASRTVPCETRSWRNLTSELCSVLSRTAQSFQPTSMRSSSMVSSWSIWRALSWTHRSMKMTMKLSTKPWERSFTNLKLMLWAHNSKSKKISLTWTKIKRIQISQDSFRWYDSSLDQKASLALLTW